MIRLLPALLALWPACAQAQAWATRAACDAGAAEIAPHVLPEAQLAALRERAAAVPDSDGRFWRVQSPGGAVSHLWGSYPSSHPQILALPQIAEARIAAARLIAVDRDFTAASRAELNRRQFPGQGLQGAPVPLQDRGFHPRAGAWIRSRTEALGLSPAEAARLSPGALAELLMRSPCEDFTAGVLPLQDMRIRVLGQIGGADVLGLEPPEALAAHLDLPENAATARAIHNVLAARMQPQPDPAFRAARFALYREGAIGVLMEWEQVQLARAYGAEQARRDLALSRGYLLAHRNEAFLKRVLPDLREIGRASCRERVCYAV